MVGEGGRKVLSYLAKQNYSAQPNEPCCGTTPHRFLKKKRLNRNKNIYLGLDLMPSRMECGKCLRVCRMPLRRVGTVLDVGNVEWLRGSSYLRVWGSSSRIWEIHLIVKAILDGAELRSGVSHYTQACV